MVSRHGRLVQVRGSTVLRAGDEVLALAEGPEAPDALFTQ
jgi:Trk K+ transport system NAD-binding subunit